MPSIQDLNGEHTARRAGRQSGSRAGLSCLRVTVGQTHGAGEAQGVGFGLADSRESGLERNAPDPASRVSAHLRGGVSQNRQTCVWVLMHDFRVKKSELTLKLSLSVPCPTCGVGAGQRCVLYSDSRRTEAHVERKLSAIEAIEQNHIKRGA